MPTTIPCVAIIGRVNTGKSTLFNRLTETKKSITSDTGGTTRDRNIQKLSWIGCAFTLVDTGGVDVAGIKNSIRLLTDKKFRPEELDIETGIIFQVSRALKEADLILILVDAQTGLLPQDRELARVIRTYAKPALCVCNKVDSLKEINAVSEFRKLGLGDPIAVSAANGSGTGDLLDAVVARLKLLKNTQEEPAHNNHEIFVSIIGKPNVGKSSLLNALVGEPRAIVSPYPMTTRTPNDITLRYKEKTITLIDTAGLKRRLSIAPDIDVISGEKTFATIKKSDIVLLVVDISEPLTVQDVRLTGLLEKGLSGVIIIANKWDAAEKKPGVSKKLYEKAIYHILHPIAWAPIVFVSAKTGKNTKKILDLLMLVNERRNIDIPDKTLNTFLKKLIKKKRPLGGMKGRRPRIYTIRLIKTNPPEFFVFLSNAEGLHQSYYRFMENELRKQFDLEGVNIKITSVQKTK